MHAQSISPSLPEKITGDHKFVFYLHGGVVSILGNNAINQSRPEWGPYEYLNILDSLRTRGLNVISENRKEEVSDSVYVRRIEHQIDSLLARQVSEENILLIGASAGAEIVLKVASAKRNSKLSFVIMGACWPDTYKYYQAMKLYGKFLSIIERTDPHGTCTAIFRNRPEKTSFKEITINTGLSHGFLYKGYAAWIDPIMIWFERN